jgi:hypothetical protein
MIDDLIRCYMIILFSQIFFSTHQLNFFFGFLLNRYKNDMNNDVDLFYIQKEECSLSFSISHVKKYSVTHDHVARKPCQVYVFFDPIATRNLILKRV